MNKIKISQILFLFIISLFAQNGFSQNTKYWQQHVDYKMDIDMNTEKYQYHGKQELTYTNNSPDTLNIVFYHLYFNAFQPNSQMDARLQSIPDPDRRMVNNIGTKEKPIYESRIAKLSPSEIGYIKVNSLKQDNYDINYEIDGTILKATLNKPLLPGEKTVLKMDFDGQVPVMIRRSGRNNPDGVALTMTQWYPKLVAYDTNGWHPQQYIAREFYGVWGNFDVKITIDKNYILGGTGYLQNANEIGYGYQDENIQVKKHRNKKLTWHFYAPNVHDFAWAADPQFKHKKIQTKDGITLHFLYKKYDENWEKLPPAMEKTMDYFNNLIGTYPWKQYSFIQGGDGGMEYAMCTMIVGGENYRGLGGTAIHELGHAWFQHAIGTNESTYAWMDEGFTSYIETLAETELFDTKKPINPFENAYSSYYYLVNSGKEEVATTNADRYKHNMAYSVMAYSKGQIFLSQLGYIIGENKLQETLKQFFKEYKFKSPTPNDFIRVAEKVSGMQLGWYLNEFIQTTHNIDYAIEKVEKSNKGTLVTLKRNGMMPMPLDLAVILKDEEPIYVNIPLTMQYGKKENPYPQISEIVLPSWGWAHSTYQFELDIPLSDITVIIIDPNDFMADIDKKNNIYYIEE